VRRKQYPAERVAGKKQELAEVAMPSNQSDNQGSNGNLGALLGAVIVAALVIFFMSGGEHFGKKTINSDADLPPVATAR
jgi:hypothetical protein